MAVRGTSSLTTSEVDITHAQIRQLRLLRMIRILWLAIFVFSMIAGATYMIDLPHVIQDGLQASPALQAVFEQLDSTTDFLAAFEIAIKIMAFAPFLFLGIVAFYRRSDNWLAFSLSLSAIFIATDLMLYPVITPPPLWRIYLFLATGTAMLLVYVLPIGQLEPKWILWVYGLYMLWEGARLLIPSLMPVPFPLSYLPWVAFAAGAVVIQVRRFRSGTSIYRQQVKWVISAIMIFFAGNVIYLFVLSPLSEHVPLVRFFILDLEMTASYVVLGIGFMIAITRYRLYDINIILNRSMVLGLSTLILAVLFIAGVFITQNLLGAENTVLALFVSALGPALLFNPTRKHVRNLVDRRLYGFRFNLNQLRAADSPEVIENVGILTGQRLGDYELLGVIGKGGMGEVYKGWGKGQPVAIKVLPNEMVNQRDAFRRFEREIKSLSRLNHPNIVRIIEHGESKGTRYMVLEFIEGRDLKKIIEQESKIPVEGVCSLLQDFADALDTAHKAGLIHRDIKPSNIMIRCRDDGRPGAAVLLDFGIAKFQDSQSTLTGNGAIGTIHYMAPEQIIEARTVDHRVDIYALGVVLFEMLTGERPFKGNTGQVLFAHLQQPPPDPREIDSSIPSNLATAILKALAKNPNDRFQNLGEFLKAAQV